MGCTFPGRCRPYGESVSTNAIATRRGPQGRGLFDFWLRFGSVAGVAQPAPSPKPRQKSKILPPRRYIIGVNALKISFWLGDLQRCRAAGAGLGCQAGRQIERVLRGVQPSEGLIRPFQSLGFYWSRYPGRWRWAGVEACLWHWQTGRKRCNPPLSGPPPRFEADVASKRRITGRIDMPTQGVTFRCQKSMVIVVPVPSADSR